MAVNEYQRQLGQSRSEAAFLRRLQPSGGFFACWPMHTTRPDGYATFGQGDAFGTGERFVHRIVYRLVWGPIPEGHEVDHRCFTPNCVHPLHLEAVTRAENNIRRRTTGTHKTHCPKGHPYDVENLYENPKTGKRLCRECMRVANRKLRARGKPLARTHCIRGHAFADDSYVYKGWRICRACVRERRRQRDDSRQ